MLAERPHAQRQGAWPTPAQELSLPGAAALVSRADTVTQESTLPSLSHRPPFSSHAVGAGRLVAAGGGAYWQASVAGGDKARGG